MQFSLMILLMTSQGVNGNLDVVEKWKKKKKIIHIHNNNVLCETYNISQHILIYSSHSINPTEHYYGYEKRYEEGEISWYILMFLEILSSYGKDFTAPNSTN
jgi:hypothetical protein